MTVTDGSGNSSTCSSTVTVADTVSPVASCQDITVFLDGAGTATIVAADIDNGSTDNCTAVTLAADITTFTCADLGANAVTLTVTDGSGNISTCTSTVTVADTVSPIASCQDITVYLDGAGNATIVAADVDGGSTDNCSAVTLAADITAFTCANLGANTVTLTVTDGSGNISTCSSTVTVADTVSPLMPTLADVIGECSATAIAPTTTDNCAGTITGTTTDPLVYTTQGTYVINWTFDDGNGNLILVPQNVIVDDVTDPAVPTLADVTGECTATAVASTTTDNCAGTITGTTTDPLTYTGEGTYVINWTFDDGNGNSIVVPQNVIIDDVTDPVIPTLADINGTCSATAPTPTTTDNCAGTVTGTTTDPTTYSGGGTYVINWTFDDGNGNSITVPQNVIVVGSNSTSNVSASVCNSYTAPSGTVLTSTGIYTDVIPNAAGCDSIITIDLTVNVDVYYSFSVTKCVEYTVPSGDETYYASGVYNDTLPTANGCDSIMTIDITIYTVDTGVSQSGITLSADVTGLTVSYQWIDCNTQTDIIGATAQDFTPTYNGDFAVVISQNGCIDTSACYNIGTIGIDELDTENVIVYPNPTHDGYFTVKHSGDVKAIQVIDMQGRVIALPMDDKNGLVDGSRLEAGKYMVRVVTQDNNVIIREIVVVK